LKVLLANGPWLEDNEKYGLRAGSRWPHVRLKKEQLQYFPFPFYMAGAASVCMEAGHEVLIRDCVAEGAKSSDFLAAIAEQKPAVVVLETSTPSIANDIRLAEQVKNLYGALVVMAGTHASAMPAELLEHKFIDHVLIHEYDFSLRNFLDALDKGEDPRGLNGVMSRNDDGSPRLNPPENKIPDLDAIPWPMREGLPMHRYNDPFCKQAPNLAIMASRGCPYACTFCVEPTVFYDAPNYRIRSPKSIVDEMQYCVTRWGAKEIYFDDSSFSVNQAHVIQVCQEIQARGLKISWSAMADAHLKIDTLKAMKAAGCVALKFGLESADPQILRNIHKHINLDMAKRMVRFCNEVGIETHATYIFGLPGESHATIETTKNFAFGLGTTTAQFAVCIPIPGTALFKEAKEKGWLTTFNWEDYDGCHGSVLSYPGLSGEEIVKAVRDCRKRLIWQVLFNPPQLAGYLKMIHNLSGWKGLWETAREKTSYLMSGA
jgi:anaerobic magnesium-protoporphyrin IX monomethyl ester cyclase